MSDDGARTPSAHGFSRTGSHTTRAAARRPASAPGRPAREAQALELQRQAGNRAAARLLGRAAPVLRRACACGGHSGGGNPCASCAAREDDELRRTPAARGSGGADGGGTPLSAGLRGYLSRSRGSGKPLDRGVREPLERSFGRGLRDVRIHSGAAAALAARSVRARAFALGKEIWFGGGQYRPDDPAGRRLIVHEVAHTLEQRPAPSLDDVRLGAATDPAEARADRAAGAVLLDERTAPVNGSAHPENAAELRRATYETRGQEFDPATMQQLIDQGYWLARTLTSFQLTVDARMNADPEEQDAVLAAVWGLPPPARIRSPVTFLVPIAPRPLPAAPAAAGQPAPAAPPPAPALLYRVTFRPGRGRRKPSLELRFVASGAGTTPLAAPAAPSSYRPTQPGLTFSGFPGTGADATDVYFTAHPDEHRALFQWLENSAPATFDQVVTTETTTTRRGTTRVSHRSVFHVSGTRTGTGSGSSFSGLRVALVSQGTVAAEQTVPADYRARDAGDWLIEEQQARSAPNRLGTVSGLSGLPATELPAVKIALAQYFSRPRFAARDTEVDARIPIGAAGTEVLYTFSYGAANDVTVRRIGVVGAARGQVDPARLDVARVRGFPGRTATPAALRAWWAARYPHGGALTPAPAASAQGAQSGRSRPAGPTAAQLVTEMNGLLAAGVTSASWFDDNWGIEVLGAADMATRLQTVHGVPAARSSDTIDFTNTDLRMLELALQTLTDRELGRLRGVKIGRKTRSIRRTRRGFAWGTAGQYGLTLIDQPAGGSPNITVVYFAPLYVGDTSLFTGSTAANALPAVVMNLLHELGHATGYQAGIEAAFEAWRRRNRPTSPTWYAASDPGEEFFSEAYALFHTDPRWLCTTLPLVFAWFEELERTGVPPGAAAALTPPAACP
jgi:hypothetical protein